MPNALGPPPPPQSAPSISWWQALTFALWGVLAAVSEDVDLVHGAVGLKQLPELVLGPGAWDLANKHLDGVHVRLVRMVQGPVHLLATAGEKSKGRFER